MTPPNEGLLASSKGMLSTVLAILRTRVELLVTEVEEEQLRIGAVFWHGLLALFFLGFGLVFLALFLTVLLWDSQRLLVLGGATGFFLLAGAYAFYLARRNLQCKSGLFSASLAELAKDRVALAPEQDIQP